MNLLYIKIIKRISDVLKFIPKYKKERAYYNDIVKPLRKIQGEIHKLSKERDGKNNYYKRHYSKYEFDFWKNIIKWIYYSNKDKPAISILDIGCSYGTLALFCKKQLNADVYTVDFLNVNNPLFDKYGLVFKQFNIERDAGVPFEKKFDVIIFTEVLEHLNFYPVSTLLKIKSMLKPNGVLYLSTPNAKYYGRQFKYYKNLKDIPVYNSQDVDVIDDHIWQYNLPELLKVFQEAGLEPIDFDYSRNRVHFNVALKKQ